MLAFTKSKKGMGQEELKNIILMLLGMIAVGSLIWYFFYGSGFEEAASETACHDALVYTAALMKQLPAGEYAKAWPSVCKTEDKVMKEKDKSIIIDNVLELAADCWFEMGEGKINPFASNLYWTENKCFVCHTFSAPNLEPETMIFSSELVPRMSTKIRPDGKTTYYDYLVGSGITSLIREPIENNKKYAVAYSSLRVPWAASWLPESVSRPVEGLIITDLNKMSGLCDVRAAEVEGERIV